MISFLHTNESTECHGSDPIHSSACIRSHGLPHTCGPPVSRWPRGFRKTDTQSARAIQKFPLKCGIHGESCQHTPTRSTNSSLRRLYSHLATTCSIINHRQNRLPSCCGLLTPFVWKYNTAPSLLLRHHSCSLSSVGVSYCPKSLSTHRTSRPCCRAHAASSSLPSSKHCGRSPTASVICFCSRTTSRQLPIAAM